jgi:hypothetical protein
MFESNTPTINAAPAATLISSPQYVRMIESNFAEILPNQDAPVTPNRPNSSRDRAPRRYLRSRRLFSVLPDQEAGIDQSGHDQDSAHDIMVGVSNLVCDGKNDSSEQQLEKNLRITCRQKKIPARHKKKTGNS